MRDGMLMRNYGVVLSTLALMACCTALCADVHLSGSLSGLLDYSGEDVYVDSGATVTVASYGTGGDLANTGWLWISARNIYINGTIDAAGRGYGGGGGGGGAQGCGLAGWGGNAGGSALGGEPGGDAVVGLPADGGAGGGHGGGGGGTGGAWNSSLATGGSVTAGGGDGGRGADMDESYTGYPHSGGGGGGGSGNGSPAQDGQVCYAGLGAAGGGNGGEGGLVGGWETDGGGGGGGGGGPFGGAGGPGGTEGSSFDDVALDHWAFEEVGACCSAGIVGGYDDGLYHPASPVSRDQMAVFISRSICSPIGEDGLADYTPPAIPSFSDVPTDFWCYKYVEYAAEHNVVGGYEDGTYQPQLPLDRGQMAVFIARAIAGDDQSVPDPVGSPSFPDVPAGFWSYRHIEYIAAEGVTGGYFDGLYHPENPVDRAQMAVFIRRASELPTQGDGLPGSPGGYLGPGSNGDTTTDLAVMMGSGGGGGGGGNQHLGVGGAGGQPGGNYVEGGCSGGSGAGGGGGAGGGAIVLVAEQSLIVSGELLADGLGRADLNAGYGAGGGIALSGETVDVTGATIRTLGGFSDGVGTTTNGGTVKVFCAAPTGYVPSAAAGRVFCP